MRKSEERWMMGCVKKDNQRHEDEVYEDEDDEDDKIYGDDEV